MSALAIMAAESRARRDSIIVAHVWSYAEEMFNSAHAAIPSARWEHLGLARRLEWYERAAERLGVSS